MKASMRHIRELMLDGQAFSEAVTNAFKPFPDAFLARVYALASRALGLAALRPQHQGQAEPAQHALHDPLRRGRPRAVRALEWIVIILILIEIIMGFSEKLLPLLHR